MQHFGSFTFDWDDGVIQRREGGRMWGESRQGGGGVILESLNCNHHLQLLPPRCTNWTSTERGRENVERGEHGEREACSCRGCLAYN